ncbi:MAG: thiol-disulfide isomerase/thioredoxin [Flavobacteriales bacterium]|jgi:thiol-disulfide isomerase/thioredoxin
MVSCKQGPSKRKTSQVLDVAKTFGGIEVVDFRGLEAYLNRTDGKTYVINFWATWCKPCIKELPYFEQLGAKYQQEDVEVLLVSLDFPDQLETGLKAFVDKKNIQSRVVLLDDPNANDWIPKVDQSWSGAIPATIIYKNDERSFYERSFTYKELEEALKEIKQ